MNAQSTRRLLLVQHAQIRADLASCVALAEKLVAGTASRATFDQAVAQLRFDIDEHTGTETLAIRDLLEDAEEWGTVLLDRMVEEHVGAHDALWAALTGSSHEIAARMKDLAEQLDAHMAAEERTFLSPKVLQGEVISRHRSKRSYE